MHVKAIEDEEERLRDTEMEMQEDHGKRDGLNKF